MLKVHKANICFVALHLLNLDKFHSFIFGSHFILAGIMVNRILLNTIHTVIFHLWQFNIDCLTYWLIFRQWEQSRELGGNHSEIGKIFKQTLNLWVLLNLWVCEVSYMGTCSPHVWMDLFLCIRNTPIGRLEKINLSCLWVCVSVYISAWSPEFLYDLWIWKLPQLLKVSECNSALLPLVHFCWDHTRNYLEVTLFTLNATLSLTSDDIHADARNQI